jgi:dipeptidyl aminopeptidase/acylaminoacyl peptidase
MNVDGQAVARLTWENYELERFNRTRQYPVGFRLKSGEHFAGTLIQPAEMPFPPRDVPLIVWQEGGPGGPMNNAWQAIVERPYALLPNFGFALLIVPLAGREGAGGRGGLGPLADEQNFGQIDIDQQAEIVGQLIEGGWTSRGKIGITGCSYGGYFTWQSIVRHPDLYAAANPQCSLVDNVVEWQRGYTTLMPYLEGSTPFARPAEYQRDSPTYNASRIKTPVLTFHGTNDFLPITLVENLHLEVAGRSQPARLLAFVGAGHGLVGRTPNGGFGLLEQYELYAAQEQIRWFREYLK